jgi:hypothetical protein
MVALPEAVPDPGQNVVQRGLNFPQDLQITTWSLRLQIKRVEET